MTEPNPEPIPAPETEQFEAVKNEVLAKAKLVKPVREMSQASIASFFYGTLQLLVTGIGAGLVFILAQIVSAFTSATRQSGAGAAGTDIVDVAGMQDLLKSLGITDPSTANTPSATPSPTATPDVSAIPGMPDFGFLMPQLSPNAITPLEFVIVFAANGFGLLAIITAMVAFNATSKKNGKTGMGLAITGLTSGFLSFVIAFIVALAI